MNRSEATWKRRQLTRRSRIDTEWNGQICNEKMRKGKEQKGVELRRRCGDTKQGDKEKIGTDKESIGCDLI